MIFRRKSPHQNLIDRLAAGPSDDLRAQLKALGVDVVDEIAREIKRGGKSARHRAELVRVLGEIGPSAEAAVPVLVRALEDESEDVSDEAAESLFLVGQPSIEALLKLLRHEERDGGVIAIGILSRFGRLAVPGLMALLTKGNAVARERAAECLGEMGDPARDARQALAAALEDKEPLVAREAQRALRRIR